MRSSSDLIDSVDGLVPASSIDWPLAPVNEPAFALTARAATAAVASSGLQINLIFDQPTSSLPTAFVAGVEAAAARFEAMFTDNITINLHVGFGTVMGQALGATALGESIGNFDRVSASDFAAADPFVDAAFAQTLGNLDVSDSELNAVNAANGFSSAASEAWVGFSNAAAFTYDDSNGVAKGAFDFFGVFAHEVAETMGRVAGLSDPNSGLPDYSVLDLFRYMNGQHDLNISDPTYFSVDGSPTGFDFNLVPKEDPGDWATEPSVGHDAFLAASSGGHDNVLSIFDLQVMQALGFHIASTPVGGGAGLFLGTTGSDTIVGSTGNDTIVGGPGPDSLTGGGGADTFVYQFASDSSPDDFDIIQDFITGQDKIDLVAVQPSSVAVVRSNGVSFVFLQTPGGPMTIASQTDVNGTDFITGGTNHGGVFLIGDGGTDTLIGSSDGDPIQAGSGADTIIGGGGGDALFAGAGTDTFVYQAYSDSTQATPDGVFNFITGADKVDLTALATSNVSLVRSGGSTFLFADGPGGHLQINFVNEAVNGDDILTGENHGVFLIGDNNGDTLIGSGHGDPIQGGSGNDLIISEGGGDAIFGGGGVNTFRFAIPVSGASTAADAIFDFKSGIDKIDLSAARESSTDNFGVLSQSGSTFIFVHLDPGQADAHDLVVILNGTTSITANDIIWGTAPTHEVAAVSSSLGENMAHATPVSSAAGNVGATLPDNSHADATSFMPLPLTPIDPMDHYFLGPLGQHVALLA